MRGARASAREEVCVRIDVLELFAEAQSWAHDGIARAELRHAARLKEQRARWEETRRVTLATSPQHRANRAESQSRYERSRWLVTRADPAKRAAHNARRMAAYYRAKGKR